MIIGLLGKKGSGKDTVGNYISKNYNGQCESFAKPLKDICKILFLFNDEQLYGNLKEELDNYWKITPRHAFQYIGTELIRNKIKELIPNIGDNFWIKNMEKRLNDNDNDIDNDNDNKKLIIITDVRFQNEVDFIKSKNGIVIKINRDNIINDEHSSEKNIDYIKNYDYIIDNNDTFESLYLQIDSILS